MEANQLLAKYLALYPEAAQKLQALSRQLSENCSSISDRTNMAGHLTSSALVLDVTQTKVLVIHHKHYNRWMQPGGHYEEPGNLWDSACREVAEETGLMDIVQHPALPASQQALDIATLPITARPSKNEGPHVHHDFAFLALATKEFEPTPQLEEVHGVKWMLLAEAVQLPDSRIRRLALKTQALLAEFAKAA